MHDLSRPGNAGSAADDAVASLAEERRRMREVQQKLATTTTVVHSKDRMVSMTFDGRGELIRVDFDGARYRQLAPTQLAVLIRDTVAAGRAEAIAQLDRLMGSDILPGVSMQDLATGRADADAVLDSFIAAALRQLPTGVADRVRGRIGGD